MRLLASWLRSISGKQILIFGLLFVLLIFTWKLNTAPAGLSSKELAARSTSQSLRSISNHPLSIAHSGVQHLFIASGHKSAIYLRMVSVIYTLIIVGSFYSVVRNWFGLVAGTMGTVLFVSSPWVINMARSATPDIMILSPLLVIASYFWLRRSDRKNLAFVALIASCATCLYVPVGVIFILAAMIISWRTLREEIREVDRGILLLGSGLGLLLVLPLIRASILYPSFMKDLVALPASWHGIREALTSVGWSILGIFWHTRNHGDLIISRLPLLNVTQVVLGLFGAYAMLRHARREFYWLAAILILGVLSSGISGNQNFLILSLVSFAIYICAGFRYLYIEWRAVFPLNPLPRALAIFLMSALVAVNVAYGVRYSLIAWPKTEATRAAYVLK